MRQRSSNVRSCSMVPAALWIFTEAVLPSKKSSSKTTNCCFVAARLEARSATAFLNYQPSVVGLSRQLSLRYPEVSTLPAPPWQT